eukprot:UN09441
MVHLILNYFLFAIRGTKDTND